MFGFHLSGLDLRQNPRCMKRSSPSCWPGPVCTRLCGTERTGARRVVGRRTRHPAPADPRRRRTVRAGTQGTRHRVRRGRAVRVFGAAAVPNYIISMCQSVSDLLEAAILLKEAGLLDVSAMPYAPVGIVPLFETIDDLQRGSSILEAALDLPLYRAMVHARDESQEVMLGYPTPTRTAATWPPTGRCTGRNWIWWSRPVRPEFGCGSSTVAAGPSVAAAAPAMTPSWRSRRERCTGRCG